MLFALKKWISDYAKKLENAKKLTKMIAGNNCLILSPSFKESFDLVKKVAKIKTVLVTSGPIVKRELALRKISFLMKSPQIIAETVKSNWPNDIVIFSFPDQIIGQGPSFEYADILGTKRLMSLFEVLLVTKHRPKIVALENSDNSGMLVSNVNINDLNFSTVNSAISSLLGQALTNNILSNNQWLGKNAFEHKSQESAMHRNKNALKELEAIIRSAISLGSSLPKHVDMLTTVLADLKTKSFEATS